MPQKSDYEKAKYKRQKNVAEKLKLNIQTFIQHIAQCLMADDNAKPNFNWAELFRLGRCVALASIEAVPALQCPEAVTNGWQIQCRSLELTHGNCGNVVSRQAEQPKTPTPQVRRDAFHERKSNSKD